MTTFSQLVDDVTIELIVQDLRTNGSIAAYVNQTLREIHFRTAAAAAPVCFPDSMVEVRVTSDSDSPFIWPIARPQRFQALGAVFASGAGDYIKERRPALNQRHSDEPNSNLFWYRSGGQIVFSGVPKDSEILISFFEFPPTFLYKAPSARVITYEPEQDQFIKVNSLIAPTQNEIDKESHWLLRRWADTVKEGTRAKIHRRRNDTDRAKMAYSSFESMRSILWHSEGSD